MGLVLVGIGVAALLNAAGVTHGDAWSSGRSTVITVFLGLLMLAFGVWLLLSLRVRLGITDDALVIQNRLRRVRIPRQAITKVYATDGGVYVEFLDGKRTRTVDSEAAQGNIQMSLFGRKGRPQRVADNVNEWRVSGDASVYR